MPNVHPMTTLVTVPSDVEPTTLASACLPLTREHPGLSGIVSLREGYDAFAARVLLAEAAEQTLDVQYYIWHNDLSGTLLLNALRRAADRGVRVRLLLDDNNTSGMDETLAALDAHQGIEVRLFNPFRRRRARWLDYLTDFSRLNRRMHNKSFTADNQVTIVGGRNVGDEYFGAGHDLLFVDLDVLAIGQVVGDVSADFERYWHSESAWPVRRVISPASSTAIARVAEAAERSSYAPDAAAFVEAVEREPFVRDLIEHRLSFEWALTRMVSDDPAKGLGRAPDDALLWSRLKQIVGDPTSELHLVSPYLVPGRSGSGHFAALAKRGVKVCVLTNSLEATDVAAVHAGYAKYRKPMLECGITLFEMKRSAPPARRALMGSSGSSRSSLHAKTFAIDRSRMFVGSFNFDPRSARLNTELGFVIDSPALARQLVEVFAERVPERAYNVRLGRAARLQWTESRDGSAFVYDREPGAGVGLRLAVVALSVLPIEWLL
jgi:putative cardiolipin synthase